MFRLKLFKFARPAMHANYFKSSALHGLGTYTVYTPYIPR
jgi:hypothetical protein